MVIRAEHKPKKGNKKIEGKKAREKKKMKRDIKRKPSQNTGCAFLSNLEAPYCNN
jgi:hypothetical protein